MKINNISIEIENINDMAFYTVNPYENFKIKNNIYTFYCNHDPLKITTINIQLTGGEIIIRQIKVNGTSLKYLDYFGVYRDVFGNRIKNKSGYMNIIGTYTFKIRYSAKSFQYMLHLIDKFQI